MTRRDYNLITQTIAQGLNECRYVPIAGVGVVIEQFMLNLKTDNKNFSELQMLNDIYSMIVNPRALDMVRNLIDLKMAELPEVTEF